MNKNEIYESSFYVRRTWTTFSGTVTKMDHVGPYGEDQDYAVAMQRKHDMDRAVPTIIILFLSLRNLKDSENKNDIVFKLT